MLKKSIYIIIIELTLKVSLKSKMSRVCLRNYLYVRLNPNFRYIVSYISEIGLRPLWYRLMRIKGAKHEVGILSIQNSLARVIARKLILVIFASVNILFRFRELYKRVSSFEAKLRIGTGRETNFRNLL